MDDMEQKLNSILGNPEMMAQIMQMAQSFSTPQEEQHDTQQPKETAQQTAAPSASGIDLSLLQKVAGIAQQSGIDRNQQALVKALQPYLSSERIHKLEKAMRAAKIAGFASTALSGSALFK